MTDSIVLLRKARELAFPDAGTIVYAALLRGWKWHSNDVLIPHQILTFSRKNEAATVTFDKVIGHRMYRGGESMEEPFKLHHCEEYFK